MKNGVLKNSVFAVKTLLLILCVKSAVITCPTSFAKHLARVEWIKYPGSKQEAYDQVLSTEWRDLYTDGGYPVHPLIFAVSNTPSSDPIIAVEVSIPQDKEGFSYFRLNQTKVTDYAEKPMTDWSTIPIEIDTKRQVKTFRFVSQHGIQPGAYLNFWMYFSNGPKHGSYTFTILTIDDGRNSGRSEARTQKLELTLSSTHSLTILEVVGGTTNPSPGIYLHPENVTVQVTAIPNMGYRFDFWELNGSNVGSTNPIYIHMSANHVLRPNFSPMTYTLTILATSNGNTDPTPGTYFYSYGSYVNVTATPFTNFKFSHWILDNSIFSSVNPIIIFMNSSHTLKAIFSPINYTLTIICTIGGKTKPPPGNYSQVSGSNITVEAIPDINYIFDHWEFNANNITQNPLTILVDKNITLKAVFKYYSPLNVSIIPSTAEILFNQKVNFSSQVSGGCPPYNYQWYVNGTAVQNAKNPNWTFHPASKGIFIIYLNVTDGTSRSIISNNSTVTVADPITVTVSATKTSIFVGQQVELTSSVSGGYPPYNYQWFLNNTPVAHATGDKWLFKPVSTGKFYINLDVTDSKNNLVKSSSILIMVTENRNQIDPFTFIFIATFAAIFATIGGVISRKKKKHYEKLPSKEPLIYKTVPSKKVEDAYEDMDYRKPTHSEKASFKDVDEMVFNYIASHGGTISLSKAASELGLTIDELKESIERLKKKGLIE